MACFLYMGRKNLLNPGVRRAANISNKHTILCDCLEPPDHLIIWVVFSQGKNMKKLFFIFALFLPIYALATDMCARNNTIVIIFDNNINGTSNGNDATEWSWWASFPYGRIAGDATCLSKEEGLGRTSGVGAYYGTGEYSNTFINADAGLSGTDANGNERAYCWCRMTHPVSSHWVFKGACSKCAQECSNIRLNYGTAIPLRIGIFDSIGR